MQCIHANAKSSEPTPSGTGGRCRIGSFLLLGAVIALSDLVVAILVTPPLGRLPFFARTLLGAMAVAVCASPVLCRFVI